jgi:hypothetical protein
MSLFKLLGIKDATPLGVSMVTTVLLEVLCTYTYVILTLASGGGTITVSILLMETLRLQEGERVAHGPAW